MNLISAGGTTYKNATIIGSLQGSRTNARYNGDSTYNIPAGTKAIMISGFCYGFYSSGGYLKAYVGGNLVLNYSSSNGKAIKFVELNGETTVRIACQGWDNGAAYAGIMAVALS